MSILVLGADGYIGWGLLCRLAATVDTPLVAVDDLSKRQRVDALGSDSAIPILPFAERLALLRAVTKRGDIAGVTAGVEESIEALVRDHRPHTVVHLAQIPSAPFSMSGYAAARETVANNELGNLALLFALRDYAPHAHLVKMGSMGEYDPCGVPIGEGYVDAVLDGVPTRRRIPFPRAADDVYHITKINDTNFLAMATRVWSLAATDVMQSIVYGTRTTLWSQEARLATRFDCDPVFGSVLNRFAAQAVLGVPLTIHGDGTQTTGLISLVDSVSALAHWIAHPADRGTHRVVNQATETRIAIRDVAQLVQRVGAELGLEVSVEMGLDPRHETEREGSCGPACTTTLRSSGIPMISLEQGVRLLLTDLLEHRARLRPAALRPEVDWKGAAAPPSGAEPFDDAVEELAGRGPSEAGSLPTARRA